MTVIDYPNNATILQKEDSMHMKNALRFVFSGYSIWLEPEQFKGDLEVAIQTASKELGVLAVPVPHATAVYGISHLGESEVKERFRKLASSIGEWPALEHKEFISDIEIDGINGGLMDMAWMEVTYETSEEHERLLDLVANWFHIDSDVPPRAKPWSPHVSLAYANPEASISQEYLASFVKRHPTLRKRRRIQAISLWSTAGTMEAWKCLDRIPFEMTKSDGNEEY